MKARPDLPTFNRRVPGQVPDARRRFLLYEHQELAATSDLWYLRVEDGRRSRFFSRQQINDAVRGFRPTANALE